MKNKRPFFYTIGIILGAVFANYNIIFNKDNENLTIAFASPVIIYISLFSIRIIRIPQIIFEFLLFLLMFLSTNCLSKYFVIIALGGSLYWVTIFALHVLRIWPLVKE